MKHIKVLAILSNGTTMEQHGCESWEIAYATAAQWIKKWNRDGRNFCPVFKVFMRDESFDFYRLDGRLVEYEPAEIIELAQKIELARGHDQSSKEWKIMKTIREVEALLDVQLNYADLPPESELEQRRQKDIAFYRDHLKKLHDMLEGGTK